MVRHLSCNPTNQELAQSLSNNESGLDYPKPEQPISEKDSDIKGSL
jgi:hypothetical protein